jgi:GT2 family glycosyltransferase
MTNDPAKMATVTVGVTTRNREQSLLRCLDSLQMLGDVLSEVIVVDDSSDVPVAGMFGPLNPSIAARTRVVRQTESEGYIVARNTIMRLAATEYVLLMDDDAYLLGASGLKDALALMEQHAEVAAIACAQAEADGRPWPLAMQPAPVSYRCRVASFIGFAHLLRRRAFHEVGGYREELYFYGEEKGLCARFLNAGYQVVYMPDVLVAHVPDPAGRSTSRYLRYVVRNDCLFALHYLPWVATCINLPVRLARYFLMKRTYPHRDPAGFFWILRELVLALPGVFRTRTPMTWSDLAEWRRLRRQPPAWQPRSRVAAASHESAVTRITVGITTRNRRASLAKALASLGLIRELLASIIVIDDGSEVPVDPIGDLPSHLSESLTIMRQPEARGNIAGRNQIMRAATTEYVLLCDDDSYLLDAETVHRGLALMERDTAVAAVGFAMAAPDGVPWPSHMQASPASHPCFIPSYIGFAHLIRRSAFLEVGGYRALYEFHGEEKDCCLRLMDAGYDIVYMPDPPVVHLNDPAGRNVKRYLRYVIRNDCLGAMFNQPIPIVFVTVPMRLARYVMMRRMGKVKDPWGLLWIVGQLVVQLPTVARQRRPVKWSTLRRWRKLRRHSPVYDRAAARV